MNVFLFLYHEHEGKEEVKSSDAPIIFRYFILCASCEKPKKEVDASQTSVEEVERITGRGRPFICDTCQTIYSLFLPEGSLTPPRCQVCGEVMPAERISVLSQIGMSSVLCAGCRMQYITKEEVVAE